MKKQNWDAIEERQEGSFDRPEPGAYIARVCRVEDNEDKEYLYIEWDFAEGAYQGYNQETYDRAGFWPTALFKSYKQKALPFFKAFKTCLEVSNRGYRFDETHLERMEGKLFGIVLGEEEYLKKGGDGTVKTRLYVAQTRSVKAIQDGDFTVPELKRLKLSGQAAQNHGYEQPQSYGRPQGFADLTDDDGELPF